MIGIYHLKNKLYIFSLNSQKWNDSFQLCPVCGFPLVNKFNIEILQFRLRVVLISGGITTLMGSFFMLPLIGFGSTGILPSSLAAAWQASMGGTIAAGSLFATLQSLGTSFIFKIIFAGTNGASFAYIINKIKENAQSLYFCDCM